MYVGLVFVAGRIQCKVMILKFQTHVTHHDVVLLYSEFGDVTVVEMKHVLHSIKRNVVLLSFKI